MDYFNYLRGSDISNPYYNFTDNRPESNVPWPLDFQSKSTQYNLNEAIAGVKQSVEDELEDEVFYDFLISKSPNQKDKEIIEGIRNDERIHNKIFRNVFTRLTGVVLPPNINDNTMHPSNITYLEGLEKAFFGELKAVEKYRKLMAFMPDKPLADMLMYVLTDEIRHAAKYNYLITLNNRPANTNVNAVRTEPH